MKIKSTYHTLSLFMEDTDLVEMTNALQLAKEKKNDFFFLTYVFKKADKSLIKETQQET